MDERRRNIRGNHFPVTHVMQSCSGYPLEERIQDERSIQFPVTHAYQADYRIPPHPPMTHAYQSSYRPYGLEERTHNERDINFPVTIEPQGDYYGSRRTSAASSPCLPDLTWVDQGVTTLQSNFDTWRPSPTARLEVKYALGSGQVAAPFSVTRAQFDAVCENYQFCPAFLRRVIGRASLFEHHFGWGGTTPSESTTPSERTTQSESRTPPSESGKPNHLEIALATFEIDAFICLLHYDIGSQDPRNVRCVLFLKSRDYIRPSRLRLHIIRAWFDKHQELLERHPLLILNVILSFIQARAHEYVRGRKDLLDMEARLGVTRNLRGLLQSGYADVSYDYEILNADLAGLSKRVADNEMSAATILEHAKVLQRIVRICEMYEKPTGSAQDTDILSITSEQQEEIQSTITRAELYLKHMKFMQDVLQSLTAVLYNRIGKNDTRSMKTIAVVTLFVLPSTLVSSIFSTGIFNFQANESVTDPQVVSSYGWVYLLTCLLLTLVTLAAWVCWYIWGNAWLDGFRRSQRL
jgi:hypothetical protein